MSNRAVLLALCDEFVLSERACFPAWCALFDKRGQPSVEAVTASQAPVHAAAAALRRWCETNPAAAYEERRRLLADQAAGEIEADVAVRALRSAEARDRSRQEWVTARWGIICRRDALTVGLGWPHRGEAVTVSTWQDGPDGEQVPVTGPGTYLHSFNIFDTSHQVWMHHLASRRDGTITIRWTTPGCGRIWPEGSADPAGDIGMRVADAPGRLLPVPLVRWPGPADAGMPVPAAPPPPPRPDALFDMPPTFQARLLGGRADRPRVRRPEPAPDAGATLF